MRAPALPGAAGLPRPRTSLVGRRSELAEGRRLLARSRLLTLTGPGGSGKTRLAIALAAAAAADHPAGVHFVSLASITDPALVPVSIAQGLGLHDSRGLPLVEHLGRYVGDGARLLVLDNFEQVLPAAEFVGQLLDASPALTILVTSRAPLHVAGEQEFLVPPLALPNRASTPTAAEVASSEAGRLFAERAAATVPGFAVDQHNAAAVAAIAHRLDGLPLALELAAARVKLLAPDALLRRLEDTPGLLASDRRDLPDRQRTLRATVSWSHDLLSDQARHLLAVCSVFRGGIGWDALAAVDARSPTPAASLVAALAELVDHSLLRLTGSPDAPRYAMLETVREYAAERLAALPEAAGLQAGHAEVFSRLAGGLVRPPCWPDGARLDLLETEHDNFRAALDWLRDADPGAGLRLANRLTAFWSARGHFSEGRRRLRELSGLAPDHEELMDALNGAAWLAIDQGDRSEAAALLDQSLAIRGRADRVAEGWALFYRARARLIIGADPQGRADLDRAVAALSAEGDRAGVAAALMIQALLPLFADDAESACELFQRSVTLAEQAGADAVGARTMQLLGVARLQQGDVARARVALEQGVPAIVGFGDRFAVAVGLTALAGLAALSGRPRSALALAGAAAAYEEINQTYRPEPLRAYAEGWLAPARATVGRAAATLFEEGRLLTVEEALALGFDTRAEDPDRGSAAAGLTPREAEIAELVAQGLSNRQIADRLVLSVRTVESHVDHALSKLSLRSRTQLAGWIRDSRHP